MCEEVKNLILNLYFYALFKQESKDLLIFPPSAIIKWGLAFLTDERFASIDKNISQIIHDKKQMNFIIVYICKFIKNIYIKGGKENEKDIISFSGFFIFQCISFM